MNEYSRGLCDDCFWQGWCQYSQEHPGEWVRSCDDDEGLCYTPLPKKD